MSFSLFCFAVQYNWVDLYDVPPDEAFQLGAYSFDQDMANFIKSAQFFPPEPLLLCCYHHSLTDQLDVSQFFNRMLSAQKDLSPAIISVNDFFQMVFRKMMKYIKRLDPRRAECKAARQLTKATKDGQIDSREESSNQEPKGKCSQFKQ